MTEELSRARGKLVRAKLHIENLVREMRSFLEICPNEMLRDPDPDDPRNEIHRIRFKNKIPDHLIDEAGEAVHQIRSALDNACFGIASATCGNQDPLHAYFPFGGSSVEFENNMRGRCKDVPEKLFPIFRAFKPYKGGDDVLWALNRVAVADKHTFLRINLASQLGNVTATGAVRKLFVNPPWDSVKNEIELSTFARGSGLHYKIEVGLTIAFNKIDFIEGEPVPEVLDYWADKAEHIISALEAAALCLFPDIFL